MKVQTRRSDRSQDIMMTCSYSHCVILEWRSTVKIAIRLVIDNL